MVGGSFQWWRIVPDWWETAMAGEEEGWKGGWEEKKEGGRTLKSVVVLFVEVKNCLRFGGVFYLRNPQFANSGSPSRFGRGFLN